MASLSLFLYSLLPSISISWTIASHKIELIAFGDNTQTVTDFGPFGFRSYPSYWGHVWINVRTDLGSGSEGYSDDWPVVENSGNTLAVYASSQEFTWSNLREDEYNNVSARMNEFDPETVQEYMRQFINATLMFQVKGASVPTQGLLGDAYTFNFDSCIADNPPTAWLSTQCQMNSGSVPIWSCAEPICDWRTVWKQYIFPNADLISAITASGVSDYKVDIQFDFAYNSYCDLHSDILYNGGEITASTMEAALLSNFPPIASGNVTQITLECDVVALTCANSNYCTWSLPWLPSCNYTVDSCDTTTTTTPPTNAPTPNTMNPTTYATTAAPTKEASKSPTKGPTAAAVATSDTNPPSASPTKGPSAALSNNGSNVSPTKEASASSTREATAEPSKNVMIVTNYTISIQITNCSNDIKCSVDETEIKEFLIALYDVQILSTDVYDGKYTVFVVSITAHEYNQISGDIIADALVTELKRDDVTVTVIVEEISDSNDGDDDDDDKSAKSFNIAITIGIIVASILLIAIVSFCIHYFCVKRRSKQKATKTQEILQIEMKKNAVNVFNNNANEDVIDAVPVHVPGAKAVDFGGDSGHNSCDDEEVNVSAEGVRKKCRDSELMYVNNVVSVQQTKGNTQKTDGNTEKTGGNTKKTDGSTEKTGGITNEIPDPNV